ncbi:class II aaRS and biotin synthetase [Teratosphaeria destructans]|uniref:Lysyl-tRNA synthetase n=1 Tax=Teratosphaeria destructans TaxID=418781 RepID=A0A9W7VYP5_9PEZI|nr:class II aaRS and biotin synthetase [Teratosphaeria destructans]
MAQPITRRLRPHLFHRLRTHHHHHHHPHPHPHSHLHHHTPAGRTFSAAHAPCQRGEKAGPATTHDYERRVGQLQADKQPLQDCYPRLPRRFAEKRRSIAQFRAQHETVAAGQTGHEIVTVVGRISSVRTAGSKLVFLDISDHPSTSLQAVCQLSHIPPDGSPHDFPSFRRIARRGDWYAITGHPHRTQRGELSVLATALPRLLSPSLHQIPDALDDPETRARNRHIDALVNPSALQPLLVRHHIERHLSTFLDARGFVKVQPPPILTGRGRRAVARAFDTEPPSSPSLRDRSRLPQRSVDATHNPEFSICEFYEAFATLDDLLTTTESLLADLESSLHLALPDLPAPATTLRGPYPRLEFLPTLESALNHRLPSLTSPTAQSDLHHLFLTHVPDALAHLPAHPTLPRLLDALSTLYLEPLCQSPTYITHHPAALSPLAKHFVCPRTGQTVAARAELFIRGREYANMYEEENSPFEQRRKLAEQVASSRAADGDEGGVLEHDGAAVDEAYVAALEWGLPPTGGWGCGVERLVMLFSGRDRIAEVLPFGTVRNVAGLGRR